MAYLVTGGTGLVGSYVVRDLVNQGQEVVCFQRSGVPPEFFDIVGKGNADKVKIVQGDVSNTLHVFNVIREQNIERIVHTGYLRVRASNQDPAYALQVNCIGMNNLLEAARLFGLAKVVWTSSTLVFGRLSEFYKEPIKGDQSIYAPESWYAATKALNEFMAKLYFEKYGIDVVTMRLGFTWGIGKSVSATVPGLNQLIRNVALGIPATIVTKEADRIRTFSYVENVSDLLVTACNAPATKTRAFHAVSNQCSYRQLVEIIQRVNPQAKVTIAEEGETEMIYGDASEPILDTTGTQTEFAWKPKYTLEEGIRKVCNYYRQQENLPPL